MCKLALFTILLFGVSFLDAQAQGAKLLVTDIQIANNAGRYEKYADKEANLSSDIPITLLIYRENNVSYYATFLFTQRGKKLRLKISDYLTYNDQKVNGESHWVKHKISNRIDDERMAGVRDEEIVYDEAMDGKVRIVFRYEVLY